MKRTIAAFASVCATVALASVETISNNTSVLYIEAEGGASPVSLYAATAKRTVFPSEVGTPIFWFDASETNGWEFAEGTLDIVKIPSKVGDRYLSVNDDGGSWTKALFRNWWQQKSPVLVQNVAELNGLSAVDFGPMGSDRGLLFNPISNEATGNVASNILHNIGTVIAVYDSEESGGYFMGGGFGPIDNGWWNDGFHWLRGEITFISKNQNRFSHLNCVGRGSTPVAFNAGTIRRNRGTSSVQYMGFGGCWEVVTFNPTEAVLQATGLGLNDARHSVNSKNRSGGMKIAEMIIFDRVLPAEDCAKVEDWLQSRYLDTRPGINGNASLSAIYTYRSDWKNAGFAVNVDVPEGETLAISKNQHGYGGCYDTAHENPTNLSAFVKTGAGTLELRDAVNYQGVVRLKEGRLAVPRKPVPSALPEGAFLHFDASDASSMTTETEGGTEYLSVWRNLVLESKYYDEAICARPLAAANRPMVLRDALGSGLNMLDFSTNSVSGMYLALATNETATVGGDVAVPRLITMVAVFGAQMGGGHLVGHKNGGMTLRRGTDVPTSYRDSGYAYDNEASAAYCNGVPVNHKSDTFQNAGYQVFALRITDTSGANVGLIGADKNSTSAIIRSGGLRLGEIALYHRSLSDDEMRDASAYLMRKWMNRTAPGYARPESAVADIQNVEAGGGEFYVPAGETATVARVTGTVPLVKTGDGVLKVQDLAFSEGVEMDVEGGDVSMAIAPDVSSTCEIAAEPSLRLRADNAKALAFMPGTQNVVAWCDDSWGNSAYLSVTSGRMPVYVADGGPNGNPYLDFGTIGSAGKCFYLSRALNSMRSVYVVCKLYDNPEGVTAAWPMPLGSTAKTTASGQLSGGTTCNFLRQSQAFIADNQVTTMVRNGIFTNGVAVAYSAKALNEVWQLIEYHADCGMHLSMIGSDRGGTNNDFGGFALGEIVAFERPLSEREKVATRNFLMKKWLGTADGDLQELPDLPVVDRFLVDGEMSLDVDANRRIVRVVGEGTLEKTGDATLEVEDWSALSGKVAVAGGVLKLTKASPVDSGEFVPEGLLFHADASQGIVATTNEDSGVISVVSWQSASDPSWTAEPRADWNSPSYYRAGELNDGRVVDMANNAKQGLVFKKDDVQTPLDGVRSVFWVIGSQEGGGFLLGGGNGRTGAGYAFHRGGNVGLGAANAKDVLLNVSHACDSAFGAGWRKNGVPVKPGSAGLSGGWDILSMNITDDAAASISVDGFAFDGRSGYNERIGSQRLAEVAIYNRKLTDDEVSAMERYLKAKWQLGLQAACATNLAVELTNGATLDCTSGAQMVGALSGAGTVLGDVSALCLVADGTATAWPTVTGTFTVPATVSVELRNVGALARPFTIKLLEAGSVAGLAKDTAVLADDEFLSGRELRLVARDGALYLREVSRTFRVIIR